MILPNPCHHEDVSNVATLNGGSREDESTWSTNLAEWTSPRVDLVSDQFLALIPRDFARQHLVLSQGAGLDNNDRPIERLIISESTSPAALYNVGVRLGKPIFALITEAEAIARTIDEVYGRAVPSQGDSNEPEPTEIGGAAMQIDRLLAEADRDLLSTQGKGPVIKLVDALLFEALGRSASDVHIQPLPDRTLVRYRLDGVLHTVRQLPYNMTQALVSRIKVMGKMDIAERRIPQDGRATVKIGSDGHGRSVDLRISSLPTSYGERVVIRLLDNSHHLCDFDKLGMPPEMAKPFLDRANRANGMILLTGPTGSGKTTTLYSTLRRIGSEELNIMTIEDPIEYELSFVGSDKLGAVGAASGGAGMAISQSQVNTKKGVTFATGLRHILRQDPDVVMVGEIRDGETARIAIQSSLTGHLVFSTLHTNDAASAVTRLFDLGVEPYLVSASLSAVLAQRLVRMFHSDCHGSGCDGCLKTGFKGRTGLFELLLVDEAIRELIGANAALSEIRLAAQQLFNGQSMRTLREDGERLVEAGITSAAEVQRVVQGAL